MGSVTVLITFCPVASHTVMIVEERSLTGFGDRQIVGIQPSIIRPDTRFAKYHIQRNGVTNLSGQLTLCVTAFSYKAGAVGLNAIEQ